MRCLMPGRADPDAMKTALEVAGSDLDHVLKCNVQCISKDRFKTFNDFYTRFFPTNPPGRIFFCVPEWTGPFDIEIDCIALDEELRPGTGRAVLAGSGSATAT